MLEKFFHGRTFESAVAWKHVVFPIKATQIFRICATDGSSAPYFVEHDKTYVIMKGALRHPTAYLVRRVSNSQRILFMKKFLSMFVFSCGCTVPEPVWFVVHLLNLIKYML